MNTVNYGDKYEKRLTLRLTETQYGYLVKASTLLGVTPSEYLRMTINAAAVSTGKSIDSLLAGEAFNMGGTSNENVKTNIDNKL